MSATRKTVGEQARAPMPLLVGTVLAFAVMISVFWVGFLGSDDSLYWEAAGEWLVHQPYLGITHWALRHTLVLPMALARALLGDGMPALLLPSVLYAVGFLIVTALWVERAAGRAAAAAAMALVVTCPQFILLSSDANIDDVEVFFVVSAFALIQITMDRLAVPSGRRSWTLLLLAGASLGLGFLSRETTVFAVATIGLLFLAGFGMKRGSYFLLGFGFLMVVGVEFLYTLWVSGNPLYRSTIALNHDATTDRWIEQGASVPLIHPLIDPFTMFLFNHNFGLLTWIGVPLSVWLIRRGGLSGPVRRLVVLMLTLAAVWSLIAAGMWTQLNLMPRYYLLPALLVSVVAGIALAKVWSNGRHRLAAVLGLLLVGGNLFAMAIDNRNYMYGEHVLVDVATRRNRTIHTDLETARRAEVLLLWGGLADRVTDAPAGSGDLLYVNPARANVTPGAGWTMVERDALPMTIGQWLIVHLLPDGTVPRSAFDKLGRGHPPVTLWRLP